MRSTSLSRQQFAPARPRLLCLAVAVGLTAAGCQEQILHDVDEETANEVLVTLAQSGISGQKERDVHGSQASYTVAVPRSDAARAWAVLRRKNLPRPRRQGLGEVFGKTGLVPTATQEQALMHHALSGELSRTLQTVDGVLEARVHLVLPHHDPLAATVQSKAPVAKASVLLRVGHQPHLRPAEIQRLVAGAVEGLAAERVSVVIVKRSRPSAATAGPDGSAPLTALGPFKVGAGSRVPLLITLLVSLLSVALLGGATLLLLRRNRALRARQQPEPWDAAAHSGMAARVEGSLSLLERSIAARPVAGSRATGARTGSS